MKVDLKSIGTFNRIGKAGATRAAEALSSLTGSETVVESSAVNFGPARHTGGWIDETGTRVAIEFDGAIEGRALLAFDEPSADYVLSNLEGAGPHPERTYLNEVANILTSSFIDGWAETLDDTVDISPPTALGVDGPLVPEGQDVDGSSFIFTSTIGIGDTHACTFYLVPEPTSFIETLRDDTKAGAGLEVDIDELTAFLKLTAAGAETVADQLEMMAGIEAAVSVSHLNFVPIEAVPNAVDDSQYTGTVFQFEGPMDGFLAILFDSDSASDVADAMLPVPNGDEEMRKSAIEELGNITASGFIDGWADALGHTIDISTPEYVNDMGQAILTDATVQLADRQHFVLCFRTRIDAMDREFECDIYNIVETTDLFGEL